MRVKAIGIDINDSRINGDLEALEGDLAYFQSCGFDAIELTTSGLYFVFNGELDRERTRSIKTLLDKFPFRYTLHLPDCLNLGNSPAPELDRRVFSSCLDFAGEVEAEVVVYHSGQEFFDLHSQKQREQALSRETRVLREMAEKALQFGILIGVENLNPGMGELTMLHDKGLSKDEIRMLHPALFLDPIAAQIGEINAPNLALTLDPGHLNLAVEVTGEDLLSSIENQAHLVRHLHLNDNFGKNPDNRYSQMEQVLYGRADCHLPLGMGSIPIGEVLKRLSTFEGFVIFEMRPEYREYLPDSIARIKEYITDLSG